MGAIREHPPVLLLMAAFSRHVEALEWGRHAAEAAWGPAALSSEPFAFHETRFYEATMGAGLVKVFFAFQRLIDPEDLPSLKHQTNAWEEQCRAQARWPEPRPLNMDPGYLTPAKLVLATTKDRDHRIYVGRGIFAEVTLHYQRGQWQARPWTYPDYQRSDYHQFFERCREYLRQRVRGNPGCEFR